MNNNIFYSIDANVKKEILLEPNEALEPAKSSQKKIKTINTYVTTLPYPTKGKVVKTKRYFDSCATNLNFSNIKEVQSNMINNAKFSAFKQGYDAFINVKVDVFPLGNSKYEIAVSGDFVKVE